MKTRTYNPKEAAKITMVSSPSPNPGDFFSGLWKSILASGLVLTVLLLALSNTQNPNFSLARWAANMPEATNITRPVVPVETVPTNVSHIAFGLMGSVKTWPARRGYLESWWRPNKTRGFVFLDIPPTPDLLPWPKTAPPYRIVDNLTELFSDVKPRFPLMPRMVHGILELFREVHDDVRWVVMGDDDSVFIVDNIVDELGKLDHTKYHYLGWHSESVISNYWFSFDQAFGGGGIVMSYPLARALSKDMEGCLIRYAGSYSADQITMTCIADVGVNLTPHKGIHQIDLHGDLSGYLSAHPKVPVMTFHHFDAVNPIFPNMDRMQSTQHLLNAAQVDHSRLLQQTVCHHRPTNWSMSVSWGYSANIYERVLPRSYLQMPIETFTPWASGPERPFYMFNTRPKSDDPCEAPHVFFMESVYKPIFEDYVVSSYLRAQPRNLTTCMNNGGHSADSINKVRVISPTEKRIQNDRSECCDVVRVDDGMVEVKFRECEIDEIIA